MDRLAELQSSSDAELEGGNETDTGFSRSRTPTIPSHSSNMGVHHEVEEDDEDDGETGGHLNLAAMRRDLDDDVDPSYDPHEQQPYASHASFNPLNLPPQTAAPWGNWTEDDTRSLRIRGPTFLDDKVKIPTGTPVYQLVWVDMFSMGKDERCPHVASRPESYAYRYHERRLARLKERHGDKVVSTSVDAASSSYLSPMIVINFLFPGPSGENMNLVLYMTRRIRPAEQIEKARAAKAKRQQQARESSREGKDGKEGKKPASLNGRLMRGGGTGSNPNSPPVSPLPGPPSAGQSSHAKPSPPSTGRTLSKSASSSTSSLSASHTSASVGKEEKEDALDNDPDVLDASLDLARLHGFDRCMRVFLEGDDHERDSRLKIIPRIAEGSWLVKKGVGTTPAILGRKVKQTYYRNTYKNYMEIDADVGSSVVAGKILSLVKSAATTLVIELTFLFQGECEEELPESLLTGVRIIHPSLANTVSYRENFERTKDAMQFPF